MSDAKKMLKELAYTHLVPNDETGDVVAVVRCKDCIYLSELRDELMCDMGLETYFVEYDGYCHHGMRKDDE